jgi:hypothetical protein
MLNEDKYINKETKRVDANLKIRGVKRKIKKTFAVMFVVTEISYFLRHLYFRRRVYGKIHMNILQFYTGTNCLRFFNNEIGPKKRGSVTCYGLNM